MTILKRGCCKLLLESLWRRPTLRRKTAAKRLAISTENLTIRRPFAKSSWWRHRPIAAPLAVALLLVGANVTAAAETTALGESSTDLAFVQAFADTHDGYSSDEILIQPDLRTSFLTAVLTRAPDSDERDALLRLLKLRKAGKLNVPTTKRGTTADSAYASVAEVAARVVTDRHRSSTDTMLADPVLRDEFFEEAGRLAKDLDEYQLAKNVLRLRKVRQLKPELVLRVADWERRIETHSLDSLNDLLSKNLVATTPGIYLFRDTSGYLYVGEAKNLAQRLAEHTHGSDRLQLAQYLRSNAADPISVELHIFPSDSPAARLAVRRAYESDLIRSRQPRFNVRP